MKIQSVFVPVPVKERLPELKRSDDTDYFQSDTVWVTDGKHIDRGFYQKHILNHDGEWLMCSEPTHWLEKRDDVFILTKEELEKVYKAGEDSKENEIYGDGETDFNDWIKQQAP